MPSSSITMASDLTPTHQLNGFGFSGDTAPRMSPAEFISRLDWHAANGVPVLCEYIDRLGGSHELYYEDLIPAVTSIADAAECAKLIKLACELLSHDVREWRDGGNVPLAVQIAEFSAERLRLLGTPRSRTDELGIFMERTAFYLRDQLLPKALLIPYIVEKDDEVAASQLIVEMAIQGGKLLEASKALRAVASLAEAEMPRRAS